MKRIGGAVGGITLLLTVALSLTCLPACRQESASEQEHSESSARVVAQREHSEALEGRDESGSELLHAAVLRAFLVDLLETDDQSNPFVKRSGSKLVVLGHTYSLEGRTSTLRDLGRKLAMGDWPNREELLASLVEGNSGSTRLTGLERDDIRLVVSLELPTWARNHWDPIPADTMGWVSVCSPAISTDGERALVFYKWGPFGWHPAYGATLLELQWDEWVATRRTTFVYF